MSDSPNRRGSRKVRMDRIAQIPAPKKMRPQSRRSRPVTMSSRCFLWMYFTHSSNATKPKAKLSRVNASPRLVEVAWAMSCIVGVGEGFWK